MKKLQVGIFMQGTQLRRKLMRQAAASSEALDWDMPETILENIWGMPSERGKS